MREIQSLSGLLYEKQVKVNNLSLTCLEPTEFMKDALKYFVLFYVLLIVYNKGLRSSDIMNLSNIR